MTFHRYEKLGARLFFLSFVFLLAKFLCCFFEVQSNGIASFTGSDDSFSSCYESVEGSLYSATAVAEENLRKPGGSHEWISLHDTERRKSGHFVQQHKARLLSTVRRRNDHPSPFSFEG